MLENAEGPVKMSLSWVLLYSSKTQARNIHVKAFLPQDDQWINISTHSLSSARQQAASLYFQLQNVHWKSNRGYSRRKGPFPTANCELVFHLLLLLLQILIHGPVWFFFSIINISLIVLINIFLVTLSTLKSRAIQLASFWVRGLQFNLQEPVGF